MAETKVEQRLSAVEAENRLVNERLGGIRQAAEEAQQAADDNRDKTATLDKEHSAEIRALKTEVEQLKKDRDELRKKLEEMQNRTLTWVTGILGSFIAALLVALVLTALGLKRP
jgi:hypothetical protein